MGRKKKVLFICGSLNQTTQMHQIAQALPSNCDSWFTPYYTDRLLDFARRRGWLEVSIGGNRMRERCLTYLREHNLRVDLDGKTLGLDYDLVVTCQDQVYPKNIRDKTVVLVQEGMLDPINFFFYLSRWLPRVVPRWVAGTAATGQSRLFTKFCVASEGYRDYFTRWGIDPRTIEVTGIPNFDNCERYRDNDFPHRDYVLVCTSDGRETLKNDDRPSLLRHAYSIAAGRQLIFKLHPNERIHRAVAEIEKHCPGALVYTDGSAEEMVANCDVLICEYSSVSFVGLALGKEVHAYFDIEELKRLLPLQNKQAAVNIAAVCHELLERRPASVTTLPVPAEVPPLAAGGSVR